MLCRVVRRIVLIWFSASMIHLRFLSLRFVFNIFVRVPFCSIREMAVAYWMQLISQYVNVSFSFYKVIDYVIHLSNGFIMWCLFLSSIDVGIVL